MKPSIPNPRNFCGGNFQDWLEVNLTDACNARCSWCVERKGWHPRTRASWQKICEAALDSGKTNIILLGGEPTLHPDFSKIVKRLHNNGRRPWVTTNGSRLTPGWVKANMEGVFGVNISIHHHDLSENFKITGLTLNGSSLRKAISELHRMGAAVRFNCNCIKGHIDSAPRIRAYIAWVKRMGGDKIRFAELKGDDDGFVDLAAVLDHKYGLNDNPFRDGCNSDAVVDGMLVNFRQMCGLQTRMRPCPNNPMQAAKKVLYYDGKMYGGWQVKEEKESVAKKRVIADVLVDVARGKLSVAKAETEMKQLMKKERAKVRAEYPDTTGAGCQY